MVTLLPRLSLSMRRALASSFVMGVLTWAGVFIDAPKMTTDLAQWSFVGEPAYAQSSSQATTISSAEIRNYALSVLDIENIRQQWSESIIEVLEVDTPPSIACNDPDSIQEMRRNAREMVIRFCNASIEIVEGHNLSISRFNAITELMNSNTELQERIQDELLNLQSNSAQ